MSATLINLDNTPASLTIWHTLGDSTNLSMSLMVQAIRDNGTGAEADMQAEVRLWGSNVRALAAQEN